MTNLFQLVVSLVEDPVARQGFRSAPEETVAGIDDLTGEDVAAVADVARIRFDPVVADAVIGAVDVRIGEGETPRDAAVRSLLSICDAADV